MSTEQPKRTGPDAGLIEQAVPPKPEPTERLTFEEYLVKYADVHAEWFPDGHVEVLTGNNLTHIDILSFLSMIIHFFLKRHQLGRIINTGMPMRAEPSLPARMPDLMVLLNPNLSRLQHTFVDGPADVVVEVVSPESDTRDRGDKFVEFEAGGVAEYWLVDPIRREVTFYGYGEDRRYHPIPRDEQGRLVSRILPGFRLPPAAILSGDVPDLAEIQAILEAMETA